MPSAFYLRQPRRPLFDVKAFRKELASSNKPIPLFKETLKQVRKTLDERFMAKGKIEEIIHDHTWFIDQILICAWERYDWGSNGDICLLAVGGYGRGELHPYSDIDIQILLKRSNPKEFKQGIEGFLTFLWDINLEVGQSVRTIKENRAEAKKDISIITALTESRMLIGNDALHTELMATVDQKKIWKPKDFFIAKKNEQEMRHQKQGDIDYALEPNIKLAPGGLRDIQTIGWIAKRYYDASDFIDLVEKGFLQKNEYQELIKGRDFLWTLRYGLHMLSGRREDRLVFDYQRKLAEFFGFADDKRSLGIEKLMKEYYRVILLIRELNDVLLQLFDEDIIRSKEKGRVTSLNSRFQVRNNYIEVVNNRVFKKSPSALLEIFVLMAQDRKIEGIRASTIRLIRNNKQLIDNAFRNDIRNKTLFMELLRSPHRMVHHLRQMKRYGILGAYLPEFGKVIGQMQHDLFHIYTVDDHTLQLVELMRRMLRHPEMEERFPIGVQVVKRLPKIELLYIAGLYHDIAKGRGGDHSELGTVDAEKFCKRHYLGKWDTNLVSWLVRNHLVMSSVAQREDIQDPEVIKDFALRVGDNVRLDYLYALTICDINATNPGLWTSWRASLMRQLYYGTRRALSQGLEEIVDKSVWIRENQLKVLTALGEKGLTIEKVGRLWQQPDEDYFFRETAEDIVWHTQAISRYSPGDGPVVLIKNMNVDSAADEGATKVFIYAKKSRFLFANIATAFERLNLNIQDARIYNTNGDFCMNTFMVLEDSGNMVKMDKSRLDQIHNLLVKHVAAEGLKQEGRSRATRRQRHFTQGTATNFSNDPDFPYSTLEVLCPDRPGLLAKVAAIFVEENIILHNAKITTLGENVEDVFFITDERNHLITNTKKITHLQERIKETLDAEISATVD